MRAPFIVLTLALAGGAGYYFYQGSSPAEPEITQPASAQTPDPVRPSDGAAPTVFNDICIAGRASFSETERRALAAGWVQAADDVDPRVARIMAISRGADVPGASNVVMHAYANPDRPQFLVLTGLNVSGIPTNGCYVYDFGATSLPSFGSLEAALGEPNERIDEPGVVDSKKWTRPAAFPGVATLRAGYFPPGSPAEPQLGFSGLLFAVTSMSR
jgi:hypothetical protein